MLVLQKYRTCRECGIVGGLFFTRSHTKASGKKIGYISSVCAVCARENARERYRKAMEKPGQRLKKRLANRLQKKIHQESTKEGARKYYLKNKEAIRQRQAEHYEKNKDRILAKCREYRAKKVSIKKPKRKHVWEMMETARIQDVIKRRGRVDQTLVL